MRIMWIEFLEEDSKVDKRIQEDSKEMNNNNNNHEHSSAL